MPVVLLDGPRSPIARGCRERRRAACAGRLQEHRHPWGNHGCCVGPGAPHGTWPLV